MTATITVRDNRTYNGKNYKTKEVNSIDEAIKWAKGIKNRVRNSFTISDSITSMTCDF